MTVALYQCIKCKGLSNFCRWFTRYLARLRSYHCRRKLAATKIQSKIRTYIARLLLKKLIRDDRAVRIQSVARIVLAKRKVLKMRRHSRSIRIQCIVRRRLARVRLIYLRKLRSGSIIWHWYISKKRMYLLKRMRVLLKYMKLFLKRRRYLRLIVYRTLALNYRGRCCRAVLIQRYPHVSHLFVVIPAALINMN